MKIAICGNYGVGNIGDSAILTGLLKLIKNVWPGSQITVFGKGKLLPFGFRSFLKAFVKPNLWSEPLKELRSSDIFILGGGGLFTDEEGAQVSLFWALQGLTAYFLNKPVLCLGVSVGPIKPFNRWFIRKLFNVAKLVTVRDVASQKYIEKCGIKVENTGDLAFLLQNTLLSCSGLTAGSKSKSQIYPRWSLPRHLRGGDDIKKYIVLSVRSYRNLPKDLYKIFAQVLDKIIRKYTLRIRLIPFQDGTENDWLILNKIFDQMEFKHMAKIDPFYENIDELLTVLHDAELVIAMRLHAGILSLLASTPFIPIDYMAKVGNFWEEFAEIKPVKISKELDRELLEAFEKIFKNQHFYREKLTKIKEELEAKAKRLLPLLKKRPLTFL